MITRRRILGGITLTGKEAMQFRKQFIENPIKHNKLSQESLDRGLKGMAEFEKNGFIEISYGEIKK